MADEQGLLGDPVEESGLVGWVDRTHGDAVNALGEEVVDDLLLFRGAAGGRDAEIDLDVAEFLLGGFAAGAGDGPEGGGVVADERELKLFA